MYPTKALSQAVEQIPPAAIVLSFCLLFKSAKDTTPELNASDPILVPESKITTFSDEVGAVFPL